MNLLTQLRSLFEPALTALAPDKAKVPNLLAMIKFSSFTDKASKPAKQPDATKANKPASDSGADYQANCAMALAKELNLPKDEAPRVAKEIIAALPPNDILEEPIVTGQGFINLRLKSDFLAKAVQGIATDPKLGVAPATKSLTFVIDYSSPNVAKPLHVGHLRSTIIGDALTRILRFLGHKVITDNHLGDWGTQFGILLYGYRTFLDKKKYAGSNEDKVRELARPLRSRTQPDGDRGHPRARVHSLPRRCRVPGEPDRGVNAPIRQRIETRSRTPTMTTTKAAPLAHRRRIRSQMHAAWRRQNSMWAMPRT